MMMKRFWKLLNYFLKTFIISGAGLKVGNVFGLKYKSKAEIAGGIILILIGIKILLEHLDIINF